jgi:PAS domain S-box-containing protein
MPNSPSLDHAPTSAPAAPSSEELLVRIRALEAERDRLREEAEARHRDQTAALRQSERRFRMLFDSIDAGFCMIQVLFDPDDRPVDYRFLEANPAFVGQTGLQDAIGRTARELLPTLEDHWFEIYGRVARTGESIHFENGSEVMRRWFDVFAFRVDAPEQHKVGLLFRDITEQKNAREALRAAKEAAEQASQAKSQFLAVMSHELRTPLTGVIAYSELMETEVFGPVSPRQHEALTRIKANSWHLVSIIEEILALSRAESGKEEVRCEAADLAEITREVVRIVESEADQRGLALRVEGAVEPLCLLTDAGKVRQILVNLVGNAVKYTERGEVTVQVDRSVPDRIALHVRDTGPGIAPADQERVFEPFTQVDSSHTRTAGGTGLGLAISRKLARLLGGEILLQSTPGEGSTFSLRLPRRDVGSE